MAVVYQGMLFADFYQFSLIDPSGELDDSIEITDEQLVARVLWLDNILVVFTVRNMSVPVTVELHMEKPALELDHADHAVTAGMRSGGVVAIAGCTDYLPDAARFSVPAGDLEAAIVCSGLGTLSKNGLVGNDRYTVHLWPGRADGVRVLKQWTQWNDGLPYKSSP
jgi:hypothetical protein